MGLFDKKYCSICNDRIGLFGNRKLDDGNLCKNCASKLSPWFSERRHSTVEQIREQLAYREANKEKVAAFHCTRTVGSGMKVLFDEDKRLFMVTRSRNLQEANPDVLAFRDVTGCDISVAEDRSEVRRKNEKGEMESYSPKRYEYSYDIKVLIHVNHPYFSEIEFKINDHDIQIGQPGLSLLGIQQPPRPELNMEYRRYMENAEEIRSILTEVRENEREEAAPRQPVICKACGAKTVPDASGCCEYCGTLLQ